MSTAYGWHVHWESILRRYQSLRARSKSRQMQQNNRETMRCLGRKMAFIVLKSGGSEFFAMTTQSAPATLFSELKTRIELRQARVAVIGLGYVGLPLALLYNEQKFPVTGFDIDEHKVATLAQGGSYIFRIPATEIQEARANGFEATSDYARLSQMDAIIICVPTPLNEYHEPDLSYITGTVESIAPHLHEGQLVVLESTTYPGTTEELVVPRIENGNPHGLKVARNSEESGIHVAFSPERENPGEESVA